MNTSAVSQVKVPTVVEVGLVDAVKNTGLSNKAEKTKLVQVVPEEEPKFEPVFKSETLKEIIEAINKTLRALKKEIKLKVHEETKRVIIQIIDAKTQQVLKEIPPEKILNLVLNLEKLLGLTVDEKR